MPTPGLLPWERTSEQADHCRTHQDSRLLLSGFRLWAGMANATFGIICRSQSPANESEWPCGSGPALFCSAIVRASWRTSVIAPPKHMLPRDSFPLNSYVCSITTGTTWFSGSLLLLSQEPTCPMANRPVANPTLVGQQRGLFEILS